MLQVRACFMPPVFPREKDCGLGLTVECSPRRAMVRTATTVTLGVAGRCYFAMTSVRRAASSRSRYNRGLAPYVRLNAVLNVKGLP